MSVGCEGVNESIKLGESEGRRVGVNSQGPDGRARRVAREIASGDIPSIRSVWESKGGNKSYLTAFDAGGKGGATAVAKIGNSQVGSTVIKIESVENGITAGVGAGFPDEFGGSVIGYSIARRAQKNGGCGSINIMRDTQRRNGGGSAGSRDLRISRGGDERGASKHQLPSTKFKTSNHKNN